MKLQNRVSFNGRIFDFQSNDAGSIPVTRSKVSVIETR